MKTAVEYLIDKLTESGHLWITDKPFDIDELSVIIEKAKEIEQIQFNETRESFIKNREQTRWSATQIGFSAGFECALKSSEDYYDKLAKTQLADDDFTKEYLQNECEKICNIPTIAKPMLCAVNLQSKCSIK